jgi:hypothetical protein
MSDPCSRVGAEYGDDTWQPVCDLDAGHDGPCDWDPDRERWEQLWSDMPRMPRRSDEPGSIFQYANALGHVARVSDDRAATHADVLRLLEDTIEVERSRAVPPRLAWRPWRQKL